MTRLSTAVCSTFAQENSFYLERYCLNVSGHSLLCEILRMQKQSDVLRFYFAAHFAAIFLMFRLPMPKHLCVVYKAQLN